jgi:hypothetical protein
MPRRTWRPCRRRTRKRLEQSRQPPHQRSKGALLRSRRVTTRCIHRKDDRGSGERLRTSAPNAAGAHQRASATPSGRIASGSAREKGAAPPLDRVCSALSSATTLSLAGRCVRTHSAKRSSTREPIRASATARRARRRRRDRCFGRSRTWTGRTEESERDGRCPSPCLRASSARPAPAAGAAPA